MKKLIIASIMGAAASLSFSAHAEGGYVGLALEKPSYTFNAPDTVTNKSKSGAGLKLFGGHEFNNHLGIEAGYADFGNEKYAFSVAGSPGTVDGRSTSMYLAGRFAMPINDMFSAYAKLGAARTHFSASTTGIGSLYAASENKTGLYGAIGGEYNINKNAALSLEYENFGKMNSSKSNSGFFSLGVKYKF